MGRSMLFLVGGMVIIFGLIQIGMMNRESIIPQRTAQLAYEYQALNLANSMADYALREVRLNQDWKAGFTANDLYGTDVNVRVFDQTDLTNPDLPENLMVDYWDQYTLVLYSTAVYGELQAVTEVLLRKDSFSKYSYFTNHEPSNIYFISADTLFGPVHSNGRFNIAGSPVFNGHVSSTEDWFGHPSFTNEPQFNDGSNFNAEHRSPPTSYDLNQLKDNASQGGLKYNNEIEITFLNNGYATIREKVTGTWNNAVETTINLSAYNGLISSSKSVRVQGVVNGAYTIHSEDNIRIIGDITYNTNPIDDPNSSDMLGIVSEKSIIVAANAHSQNGTKDLNIHASLMALDQSFTVENYNSGGSKGELKLLGGIIQQQRGPVGTFSGGSVVSGFSKNYKYDERLLTSTPPNYPRESIFTIVYWFDNTKKINP